MQLINMWTRDESESRVGGIIILRDISGRNLQYSLHKKSVMIKRSKDLLFSIFTSSLFPGIYSSNLNGEH